MVVNGSFPDVSVSASGTSKVYVLGLNPDGGTAEVTVSGITTVWIQGGAGGSRGHCLDPGGTRWDHGAVGG